MKPIPVSYTHLDVYKRQVGELHHFQVVALSGQVVLDRVEDLRMGGDGRAHLNGDQLRGSLFLGLLLGGGFGGRGGGFRGGLFRRGLGGLAGAAKDA